MFSWEIIQKPEEENASIHWTYESFAGSHFGYFKYIYVHSETPTSESSNVFPC